MQHITVYTMTHRQKGLNEVHARFLSLLAHLLRPDASLDLTNVSLMKQYHAQTALTDTATNAQRQLVVQELLMEVKLLSILLALQLKLTQQTLLIDTDTHRTELETATQNRIPDEDITIQSHLAVLSHGAPVIIVRSSAIMLLAIAQLASDALYKYSAILLADFILALLRRKVWIHIEQILRMNKMNLLRQERLQLGIMLASQELGTQDGTHRCGARYSRGRRWYGLPW